MEQTEHEMQVIAESGMEEILILTGESRGMSGVKYIGEACRLARKYFRMVGLETLCILKAIIAVENKVDSPRAVQFRKWVNGIEKFL